MKFNQTLSKDSLTKLKTFFYEKSKQKRKPVLGGEQKYQMVMHCHNYLVCYDGSYLLSGT